jgi:hypothetical protein
LPKGAPLNKINDHIYKSNQWITIVDNNNDNNTSLNAKRTPSEKIASLVETFAGDFEHDNDPRVPKYKVNDQVGTLIAQKLESGEKLRFGRNGEAVNPLHDDEDSDFFEIKKKLVLFRLVKKPQFFSPHGIEMVKIDFLRKSPSWEMDY